MNILISDMVRMDASDDALARFARAFPSGASISRPQLEQYHYQHRDVEVLLHANPHALGAYRAYLKSRLARLGVDRYQIFKDMAMKITDENPGLLIIDLPKEPAFAEFLAQSDDLHMKFVEDTNKKMTDILITYFHGGGVKSE